MGPKAQVGAAPMQTAEFPAVAAQELAHVFADACAGFLELADPPEILEHLAKTLRRAVAHEGLVIFEADWSRLELRPAVLGGTALATQERALPLGAGAAGRAFARGQHESVPPALLVPLLSGPRRLGVLELRRREGEGFGPQDVERCTVLAGLAAAAWRRSEERARLEQRALLDACTGLLNHRWWEELGEREARQAARTGSPIGLLYVDLDDFGQLVDALGPTTADMVLSQVGRVLRSVVDPADAVVRFGGDDLVVLLRDCDAQRAAEVAEEVLLAVPAAAGATAPGLTASVGIAMFPEHGGSLQAVAEAAESAMRAAKAAGKARLARYQPPGSPGPSDVLPGHEDLERGGRAAGGAAHRAAISQLEEEHRRLVEAQHLAMIGSFEMDLSTGDLEWSPELRRIVGIPADELPSPEGVMDRVHPEDVEGYTAAIRDWVEQRSTRVQHTFRIVHDDGSTRHVQVRLGARRREDGHRLVSGTLQDVTERVESEQARRTAEDQLRRLRLEDPLTGLPNRELLDDRLDQSLRRARQTGMPLAVLLLDVDSFKRINDSLGRAVGDRLLVQLARRLALGLGAGDTAARLSGDEFVVVHEGVATGEQARQAGSRLLASLLADPFVLDGDGDETFVTASCGVVVTSGEQPAEDALGDAEAAMYAAKALGGGRIVLFDESMRRRPSGRLGMEAALRRAIERRELVVSFQPVVRLADDALVGVEALARWPRPGLPPVGPSEFVPMAESMGLIDQLGDCVLDAALQQVAAWRREIPAWRSLFVSVNLSPRQLLATDLLLRCRQALERHGLPLEALRLEVTEEALVEEAGRSASILREISDSGIAIAMDDFGTGFSSLSRLKQLPVSTLKIDRSFVDGLGSDPSDTSIVRAIVGLGHALGLELCAEGVEMPHQRDALAELGCHHAQGFLWAQPLPAEELARALAPHGGRVPPRRRAGS